VAELAAKALVLAGPPAVPDLIGTVQGGAPAARIHALRALAELRDPRAIPVMLKMTEADSAVLKYWAEEGLQRLGLNMVYIKPG
jgi:HEAT repeat protein